MLRISSADWARLTFAKHVARLTEPGAPVVFATKKVEFVYKDFYQHRSVDGSYLDCDPVDFYLSDRKGWSIDEAMATPEFLEGLRRRGAKYFATNLPELLQLRPELVHVLRERHMALEVTADWAIYRLSGPIVPQDSRSATSSLQAAAVVQTGRSK